MARFVVRRLLLLVPILLGLSILLFVWVRALPGSTAQAILGERATPAAIAQFNHQYGLDRPITTQYWAYLKTTLQRRPGHERREPPAGDDRDQGAIPRHDRACVRRHDVRARVRAPARVLRGKALRAGLRPLEPLLIVDRGLDPGLLPGDHPQVHLLRPAGLAAEHRPPGRADRRRAPDGVLRPRRDRHRQLERRLGRIHAPAPAGDRARLDSSRDHRARHPRVDARRSERGLRSHGEGQGSRARHDRPPACACGTRCCR